MGMVQTWYWGFICFGTRPAHGCALVPLARACHAKPRPSQVVVGKGQARELLEIMLCGIMACNAGNERKECTVLQDRKGKHGLLIRVGSMRHGISFRISCSCIARGFYACFLYMILVYRNPTCLPAIKMKTKQPNLRSCC